MKSRVSSLSAQLLGVEAGRLALTALASTTWPTANRALFIPFALDAAGIIPSLYIANGAAVSGNVDVGIYSASFQRLASAGGVTQTGTNNTQILGLSGVALTAGAYWLALVLDNLVGTIMCMGSLAGAQAEQIGIVEVATAYPLPAAVTPATPTMTILPLVTLIYAQG
jgi:hypothetical protein